METGRIVRSRAGRDKNRFMVVVFANANAVFVCDGKERPLERPKKKNPIHLTKTAALLQRESMATNREIRKSLRRFSNASDDA